MSTRFPDSFVRKLASYFEMDAHAEELAKILERAASRHELALATIPAIDSPKPHRNLLKDFTKKVRIPHDFGIRFQTRPVCI